ncbi:MAG: outer membrane lipoprotein carrier protein LolA [Candidatus Sumerlaeia bacterium]|nr:outer membrane lipoprotein carrier protein LolA [Candidatus Sumerlaeia bacterium]
MTERLCAAALAALAVAVTAPAQESSPGAEVAPSVHETGAPPVRAPERTYQELFGEASAEEAAAAVSPEGVRLAHDPEALDLLNQMAQAHADIETLQGTFTQHKVSELFLDAIDSTGRVAVRRPDRFRYDYDGTDDMGPHTYWDLGGQIFVHMPDLNQLEVYDMRGEGTQVRTLSHLLIGLDQAVEELQTLYWIQMVSPDPASGELGENVARLRLTPREGADETGATGLDLWVDRESLLPVQVKTVEESGDETTLRINSLTLNPALDEATFDPMETIPEGTEIVEPRLEMTNRP